MRSFITIIKYDYLQRARSYAFLITLLAGIAFAYSFIPSMSASYTTISISDYIGIYNSAWIGTVTAMMTAMFLFLIGFYLISNSIAKDIETNVGQIVATTQVGNMKYLLTKTLSNFLVLMTIVCIIFLVSLLMVLDHNEGYPFEIISFVNPYIFITIPAMFIISVVGVVFEVVFRKYNSLKNIGFFIFFSFVILGGFNKVTDANFDIIGTKIAIQQLESQVGKIVGDLELNTVNIGYIFRHNAKFERFEFTGVDFSPLFMLSRLIWMILSIGLLALASFFFHRFDIKKVSSTKKESITNINKPNREILLSQLKVVKIDFGIWYLLKFELLMLLRKGKKWMWIVNIGGMVALFFLDTHISLSFVLPVLWFLQVNRLADISAKEHINNVHHFTSTSIRPTRRLLLSQLLAGIILMIGLVLPLLIKLLMGGDLNTILSILLGAMLLVFIASILGIITKGKRMFEVLFFFVAYANINNIPMLDYFGGLKHGFFYIYYLLIIVIVLGLSNIIFYQRK